MTLGTLKFFLVACWWPLAVGVDTYFLLYLVQSSALPVVVGSFSFEMLSNMEEESKGLILTPKVKLKRKKLKILLPLE